MVPLRCSSPGHSLELACHSRQRSLPAWCCPPQAPALGSSWAPALLVTAWPCHHIVLAWQLTLWILAGLRVGEVAGANILCTSQCASPYRSKVAMK